MTITDPRIDGGAPFDWGRVSAEYARSRDIYPPAFYDRLIRHGLCGDGCTLLDVGTGTAVLPRHLCRYGGRWVAADISPEQIRFARALSAGLPIDCRVGAAETLRFPDGTFDAITACQCLMYFDHDKTAPLFYRWLKPGGSLWFAYMAWLPAEDPIAGASERLILRYSPQWSGANETPHPIDVPASYSSRFTPGFSEVVLLDVPFDRESWHGRVVACRAVGASLPPKQLAAFEREHRALLAKIAPARFAVRHYAAFSEWKKPAQGG